jgi:transposase InsO family protein
VFGLGPASRGGCADPRDAWFAINSAIARRPPERPVEELEVELVGLSGESGKQSAMFEGKGKLWRQIEETGEIVPIAIVTDNGSAYRSAAFARYVASRPEFTHVRTRHRSPQTNGVIERFFQPLKYEYLYRQEIGDGAALAAAVGCHQTIYNDVRPHEAIGFRTPLTAWRDFDGPRIANQLRPQTVSLS